MSIEHGPNLPRQCRQVAGPMLKCFKSEKLFVHNLNLSVAWIWSCSATCNRQGVAEAVAALFLSWYLLFTSSKGNFNAGLLFTAILRMYPNSIPCSVLHVFVACLFLVFWVWVKLCIYRCLSSLVTFYVFVYFKYVPSRSVAGHQNYQYLLKWYLLTLCVCSARM